MNNDARTDWEKDYQLSVIPRVDPPRRVPARTFMERWKATFDKWWLVIFFLLASLFFEAGYAACWWAHYRDVPVRVEAVVYPVEEP